MKKTILFILLFTSNIFATQSINKLFPEVSELYGGEQHWIANILPIEKQNSCVVHSATYAYFTTKAKPLFDIPRKNVYSVNIRFHVCENVATANKLFDKYAKIGDDDKKRLMSIGEKAIIYIEPSKETDLMGNYYLTSISKYIVMQVHADDGFVLMDIAGMMEKRLALFLSGGKNIAGGITIKVAKEGYDIQNILVPFNDDAEKIEFTGILYDQYNQRVPNATLFVAETGTTFKTDEKGNFNVILGNKAGDSVKTFRVLNVTKKDHESGLSTGFYAVDIYYKLTEKVGQDHWHIQIHNDGSIKGSSLNLSSGSELTFTGTIKNNKISINRPCGSGMVATCRQTFKGELKDEIIKGDWTGSGGGGQWTLYKNSFEPKVISVTPEETGIIFDGKKAGEQLLLIPDSEIKLTLKNSLHNFYLMSAILKLKVDSKSNGNAILHVYKDKNKTDSLANSPYFELPKHNETAINITDIFKLQNKMYFLSFPPKSEISASVTPAIELAFANLVTKANSKGTIKLNSVNFNSADIAGYTKAISGNKKPDILLNLDISAFGNTLKGLEIQTTGKDSRKWNTSKGNIYPGIAITVDDTLVNNEDGSINYPMEKYNTNLLISIDKGSAQEKNIKSFKFIFLIDNNNIEYEYKIPDKRMK